MRTKLIVVFLTLSGMGLNACVSTSQYRTMEAGLSQQLRQERQQRREVETQLAEMANTADQRRAALADLQSRYGGLQSRYSELAGQNLELSNTLERLSTHTATLQTDVVKNEALLDLEKEIVQQLQEHMAAKNVTIEAMEGKLKVTFVDQILFSSGSAQINAEGQETLQRMATTLRQDTDHEIVVQGHTDDVRIGPELQQRFPTNWELSTARAAAVVRFLQEQGGLDPRRLAASGFSHYRSVASNESEAGRRQNRRIDIILVPIR